MTTKQIKNVQIFKYGLADNGYLFIPEEICTEDKFIDIPIVEEIDLQFEYEMNIGKCKVIGKIDNIVRHFDGYIYGNITLFYDCCEPLEFKNYAIEFIERETAQDGIVYVKDFRLESVVLGTIKY